jgi:uncharacterized zinc-type alcohol dehydrogenase-like protein
MRQVDYGFDLLMCTASGGIHWEALLNTLRKKGRLVLLGFPSVSLNPTDIVAHQLSITGSFIGNQATMREMLMPMSQVNDAIQRVKENKARYRIVLVNDMDSART